MFITCVPVDHERFGGCFFLQVFRVEVFINGRKHFIERRYRDFQALHKKLKKTTKPPDFPPKRGLNRRPKALEHKRHGLEVYIQGVVRENEKLPREVLEFLNIKNIPSLSKKTSLDSLDDNFDLHSCRCFRQQVVTFTRDMFAQPTTSDLLPNVVVEGVMLGLYLPENDSPMLDEADSAEPEASLYFLGPESIMV
uniref:Sorting nexin-24-like n=1 Tax=Callorhinchus milii TaxID=7868 RepID=A0A4W3HZF3_CALMI